MSLRRIKRNSNSGALARKSHSDFTLKTELMRSVESGFEDMNNNVSKNDISADLRNIGNKYDKLVLKMFSQRSHLRGDLMLLKKEAKLLRNEMRFLIVKHDNSTAFKKGYGAEDHEKERVLKAEVVTKEMGQLELSLAELMSKYYFLLQQTNTLKEINSLWHIRSVLKSDCSQLKSISKHHGNRGRTVRDSVVRKDSKELKKENANLTLKLRWLTKLSHEFRDELRELRAAKTALLNGRSYLEKEYSKTNAKESIQDSVPTALDIDAVSNDIRQAELRIIDSLQDRIEALDKLSDSFKDIMVKVGFKEVENAHSRSIETSIVRSETTEVSSYYKSSSVIPEPDAYVLQDLEDESDNETEEVQVRYIRQEDIDETDLRCLSLEERKRFEKEGKTKQSFYGDLDKHHSSKALLKSKENKQHSSNVSKTPSYGYESIQKQEVTRATARSSSSVGGEEFFDAEESFTSAVTVWLRPEACVLSRTASEETLTEEVNNYDQREDIQICTEIEKQFENGDEENLEDAGDFISRFCKAGIDSSSAKLSEAYDDSSSEADTEIEDTGHQLAVMSDVIDGEDRHERFFMAKSFFELKRNEDENPTVESGSLDFYQEDNDSADEASDCLGVRKSVVYNEERKLTVERTEAKATPLKGAGMQPNIRNSSSERIRPFSLHLSQSTGVSNNCARVLTSEDRPVFYDPVGVWKGSPNTTKTTSPSKRISGSNTLERKSKQKPNEQSRLAGDIKAGEGIVSSGYKTLPRGFKGARKPENNAIKSTVTPRRSSGSTDSKNVTCSTLPRKMPSHSTLKQRPVSQIPITSPEPHDPPQKSPQQRTGKASMNRPVSQVINNRQATRKSSFSKPENIVRPSSRTSSGPQSRPSSRAGSLKRQDSTTVSPRRPVSRNSSYALENAADKSRPTSRIGSVSRNSSYGFGGVTEVTRPTSRLGSYNQGNVSIYGTLPRSRKGLKNQNVTSKSPGKDLKDTKRLSTQESIENSKNSSSANETTVNSSFTKEGYDAAEPLDAQIMQDNVANRKKIEENTYGTIPRASRSKSVDTKEYNITVVDEGKIRNEASSIKKKNKILNIKPKKPKSGANVVGQNGEEKGVKPESDKKPKKTVSEKAANFMHSALRFVSSESKAKSKNATNNAVSASPAKMRTQSSSSHKEHRKSLLPVPSFS